MSTVVLSEVQISSLMQRRPFATIFDIENRTAVVKTASRPLAVYVLHVSKLSGQADLQANPRTRTRSGLKMPGQKMLKEIVQCPINI